MSIADPSTDRFEGYIRTLQPNRRRINTLGIIEGAVRVTAKASSLFNKHDLGDCKTVGREEAASSR